MTPEDHELLGRVGPGTPLGGLLRRYWTPALLSSELPERDGAPLRVRLFGEDLVAYRDSQGRVGLLREFCSHRGASLYYARNGEGGLRCWYHGWKYDVEGNCIDTPNEPSPARLKERIRQLAYPTRERNGVVWAYLGPREKMPAMPELEHLLVPESHVFVSKRIQQCFWTQGMEGDLDPSHLAFLHAATIEATEEHAGHSSAEWMQKDLSPKIELFPRAAGILYGSRRNADENTYFWRIAQWMIPFHTTIPGFPGDGPLSGHAWVPMDDASSWVFTFTWHPKRPITEEERQRNLTGSAMHAELSPGSFMPARNKSTGYVAPGTETLRQPWMRIKRFQDQDIAVTESMGQLYDRTQENLGVSDAVVARMRYTMITAARRLHEGQAPPGLNPADFRMRPISVQLPRSVEAWADAVAEAIDARPETFRASV
jgi:phthalate 4,5-dioxygenase oxygenase subunit